MKVRSTKPRTKTHIAISELLATGAMASNDVAFTLGVPQYGVESCMRGMLRHGEIKPVARKEGERQRYRLVVA